ncbi:unnamed protein product [Sphagnum jensenii]|uniref:Uncharacterized protein n=2 Tax=Sphagnum jensenii TaxID=128206 RepID=A0ABP1A443_9BRYO
MGEVNVSTVEQPVADEEELVVGSDVMYSLLFGFVGSFVLRTAVVLGLPDIIARAGPDETLTLKQIASQLNSKSVNEIELQRVLSALVTCKIFRCTKVGTTLELQYGLTPASKLLVTDNPHNQAPVVLFQTDPASQAPWQQFHRCVLYGEQPWKSAHGKDAWKYFNDNPGLSKCFNDAMASGTTVELIAHIMHDWNDENCLKILNNCKRALPEKGKVLIFDFVVPPNGGIPHMFDMVMMAHSDGGIERTEEQWRKLLTTAGFSTINCIALLQEQWLIEAVK